MSTATDNDLDPATIAKKVQKYRHLLPGPSPTMLDKMRSGTPVESAGDAASGAALSGAAVQAGDALAEASAWPPLSQEQPRDRAIGSFLGLAVGDAVGAAVEFEPRGSFPPLTDMVGGGPFSLPPGEWTDDTTMALCLAESLLAAGDVDQDDLMTRFQGWMERGENTVPGKCFDIGRTTRTAIERFAAEGISAAGSQAASSAGNGSLVRLAPLAIFSAKDPERARELAVKQSRTTHAAATCLDACKLFVSQLVDALQGADKEAVMRQRVMALSPVVLFISAGEWKTKAREEIKSTGYVVHTLEAALWSVWKTDNFRDAVLTAANLGVDSDSVAAVAGQLAGALYGASAIPGKWLAKLAWRDKIEKLANALFEHTLTAP
jgi:ADP-ribosyl-[dinitrogen reductase] hydrolase